MKTMIKKLFLLAIIFLTPNLVQAASSCTYEQQAELNDIVANVKANYEPIEIYEGKAYDLDTGLEEDPIIDVYVKGLKINILNITNDIYVEISNDLDNTKKVFYNKDTKDGIASFEIRNTSELVTYTINIFSARTSCTEKVLRTITLLAPMYNYNSEFDICAKYPEYYYCQEFISTENIDIDTFFEEIDRLEEEHQNQEQHEQKKEKRFFEQIKEFYNNNKLYIFTGVAIIVVVGVGTTVILIKKRRRRVL